MCVCVCVCVYVCVRAQMTSLTSDMPCWVDAPRAGNNDAIDFMGTMLWLLENGALPSGAIILMDNARIHDAASIRDDLAGLLNLNNVHLAFLPAYSPELNPCELVFAWVKEKLRVSYAPNLALWERVQGMFAQVPRALVLDYYKHVLFTPHTMF